MRVMVIGDKADVYFNSNKPVLHIPDIKTEFDSGPVNLRVSGGPTGVFDAYFSNVNIRELGETDKNVGVPQPAKPLPDGIIRQWRVSSPVLEDEFENATTFRNETLDSVSWSMVDVETNGIANLSKVHGVVDDRNTILISKSILSNEAKVLKLKFGYSDRVRIFLNGKLVFAGDATWRERDYRFLGTVGFSDSVGLDLLAGENELLVAVSETFGGWAWAGAIANNEAQ